MIPVLIDMLIILANIFPVILVVVLLVMGLRKTRQWDQQRFRAARPALFLVLAFLALDLLVLMALPWLGLSYGKPHLPFLVLWVVRLTILALMLLSRLSIRGRYWVLALIHTAITAGLIYTCYIEPFNLTTTFLTVPTEKLSPGTRLRVLHITDLHVERITPRERAVMAQAAQLKPDLIVLTGDYLNISYLKDAQAIADLRAILESLEAPLGIYAVNGSAERPERLDELVAGLEVTTLHDETRRIPLQGGAVSLIGINDLILEEDARHLREALAGVDQKDFLLLLFHTPDLIQTASQTGIDLYLAGHTHGGQIRIPFYGAVITYSVYGKQFEAGHYLEGSTQLYVSRGLGMEGFAAPRARFLAPPEIVVVDIIGQ